MQRRRQDEFGVARSDAEIRRSIGARVARVYPGEVAPHLANELMALADGYRVGMPVLRGGWSEKDAFLITYADTLVRAGEAPLRTLDRFLSAKLGDAISLVHLLPFYPFSSDDGFSVIDYRAVREDLGDWQDVEHLALSFRLVVDAVVNHVSRESEYIQGYLAGDSRFDGFALALDPDTDTSSVLRTRNLPLLHPFDSVRGVKHLWTTFSADQVDLNYHTPAVLLEMTDVLFSYARHGASMLRLDAIPYLWKKLGTSCAHLPETHEIIKLWRDLFDLAAPHLLLLTETNVPHRENVVYFGDGGDEAQVIYNFALPPLILWSLHAQDATELTRWARGLRHEGRRTTYLNVTSTHDGIGMRPTEGILSEQQRAELCELARRHGGAITGKSNPDGSISVYELNVTYFDALNDPVGRRPLERQIDRFLVSQAITMSLMGIPAFYLPSLLGARNDGQGVARTGRARSINRPYFDVDALCAELDDSDSLPSRVLNGILHLLEARRGLTSFHPDAAQEVLDLGPDLFAVRRGDAVAEGEVLALHSVVERPVTVDLPAGSWRDARSGETCTDAATLPPYGVRWLLKGSET